MRLPQRELHRQLRAEAMSTRERVAGLLHALDPGQLNEHPEPNGWSVGQVCEHLIVADERYEQPFAGAGPTPARLRVSGNLRFSAG